MPRRRWEGSPPQRGGARGVGAARLWCGHHAERILTASRPAPLPAAHPEVPGQLDLLATLTEDVAQRPAVRTLAAGGLLDVAWLAAQANGNPAKAESGKNQGRLRGQGPSGRWWYSASACCHRAGDGRVRRGGGVLNDSQADHVRGGGRR